MGLEEDVTAFVKPYKILLWRISKFVNPFITERLEQKDFESHSSEKRKEFLRLFKSLPVPSGSSLIRTIHGEENYDVNSFVWHRLEYFCRDIIVTELDYESFKLSFWHENKKLGLDKQDGDIALGIPLPGSTLGKELTIYFKEAQDLDWKALEPKDSLLLKPKQAGYSYESKFGLSECGYPFRFDGYFLSKKRLNEGSQPIISFQVGGKSKNGEYASIEHAVFNLKKLGYGELNAFMKHLSLQP